MTSPVRLPFDHRYDHSLTSDLTAVQPSIGLQFNRRLDCGSTTDSTAVQPLIRPMNHEPVTFPVQLPIQL